jgi:O-succinylbenzoic acid--CoA ligase
VEELLKKLKQSLPGPVTPEVISANWCIIAERDPVHFWNRFCGALAGGSTVVLVDPDWPENWKRNLAQEMDEFPPSAVQTILVPTGGTSGRPRLCIHTIDTLMHSAESFRHSFGEAGIIHNVNVLPQHHVGGLMPVLRSAASGGKTFFTDYRKLTSTEGIPFDPGEAALSLVPTQLQRILEQPEGGTALAKFGLILIGGAACPDNLLDKCRSRGLRLAPCYGSTETAAMVTVLDPREFLSGGTGVGSALPGTRIEIGPDQGIRVFSKSCCHGYHPPGDPVQRDPICTRDLGQIDDSGSLHILGRMDRVVITGGENVIPEQVEAVALRTGLVEDAHCRGVPDNDWGQRVELSVVPRATPFQEDSLLAALRNELPPYAVPKRIHITGNLYRNALGKQASYGD